MNEIGNVTYNFTLRTYKGASIIAGKNKDLEITKYRIVKETPKYYKIEVINYYTFLFNKQEFKMVVCDKLKNYKKENVKILGIMTKKELEDKLKYFKEEFKKDDNLSNNNKKQLINAIDIYLKNINEF